MPQMMETKYTPARPLIILKPLIIALDNNQLRRQVVNPVNEQSDHRSPQRVALAQMRLELNKNNITMP